MNGTERLLLRTVVETQMWIGKQISVDFAFVIVCTYRTGLFFFFCLHIESTTPMILYATQKPQVGHHNLNYSITHFHTHLVVSTIKYGTRNSACAIPLFSASAALLLG